MQNSSPLVTVIVLIYNDAAMGRRAILSAINQSYSNKKILILDNGSTDETVGMIQEFVSYPNVQVIRNRVNQRSEFGAKVSMDVESDYLSFLFSDDTYELIRIEKLVGAITSSGADAVFSNNHYQDEFGKPIVSGPNSQFWNDVHAMTQYQHIRHMLTTGNSLHPCGMLIKNSVYKTIGGFKGYLHRVGDMTFFSQLLLNYKVTFCRDKLQRITVWTTKRNESSRNTDDHYGLMFERSLFLSNYFSTKALNQIEFILPTVAKVVGRACTSIEGRRFVMGCYICLIPAPDYISIGANQMFTAYENSPCEIENISRELMNTTFSQLMYVLSQYPQETPVFIQLYFSIRSRLKKVKIVRFLYGFLRGFKIGVQKKVDAESLFNIRESSTKGEI